MEILGLVTLITLYTAMCLDEIVEEKKRREEANK